MRHNEGVHRFTFLIRAIGVTILLAGAIVLEHATPNAQVLIGVLAAVCAAPFFALAWVIDGFAMRNHDDRVHARDLRHHDH